MTSIKIKSIDVNKKISIDEESFSFGVLEDKVYELGLEVAKGVMEYILTKLDGRIREGRERKALENRGKEEKYLSTNQGKP